jgi:mannosyltransferase OCH1-like enzyme
MPIPKIVFQTWKTRDIVPELKQHLSEMMAINPEYKFEMFDDEDIDNFVIKKYRDEPDIVECYQRLNIMVAKTDFWRYLFMYKHGGIYLDMDSGITRSLNELIREEDSAIITMESNPSNFVQWCMMFEAGHPI